MKELLYLKDDQLKEFIEKLFIGHRESFSDAKKVLDKYSIGIAHHRVMHLLSIYKGITISDDELRQSMDQFLLQAKEEIIGKDNI